MMNDQMGFTLLELLLILAVISILAMVGLPTYFNYSVRAKVSEAFSLAGPAQAAVQEYYLSNGEWPSDNTKAGLDSPSNYKGEWVTSISVKSNSEDGWLLIELDIPKLAGANILALRGSASRGSFQWTCDTTYPGSIPTNYLPNVCR